MNKTVTQRAVIVPRVSTAAQVEDGTSIETQELACLRKAAELGATVHGVYRDEGVSGALYLTRQGIQNAIADVEAGRAHYLITYKLDRAGRDVDVLRDIKRRVERAGGELVFADGTRFEKNATGNLLFTQLAAFAEFERETIRERTMTGCRRLAEKGVQPSRGRRPYGYDLITEADVFSGRFPAGTEGTYAIRPDEAEVVRAVFHRYAAAESLYRLTVWLNRQGIPTPKGGKVWRARTILYMLTNPVYKGQATYGRLEAFHDERRRTENGLKTTAYQRPRASGPLSNIKAPAIVDEVTWETCQQKSGENKEMKRGNPAHRYLLSGVMRCPICGRGMVGQTIKGKRRYRCNRLPEEYHSAKSFQAGRLEAILTEGMEPALNLPESLKAAADAFTIRQKQRTQSPDETNTIRRQLAELERREAAAVQAQVDAITKGRNTDVYDRLLDDIDRERTILRVRLAELEADAGFSREILNRVFTAEEAIKALRKVLKAAVVNVDERRDIIRRFVREIVPCEDGAALKVKFVPFYEDSEANVQLGVVMYTILRDDVGIDFRNLER